MIREGRLGKAFNKEVAAFTSSIDFDRELFEYDILTDMAHLLMLHKQGIVDEGDTKKILTVLKRLLEKGIGEADLDPSLEDIHMVIEAQLLRETGDVGGKLHTGRSRNDQIATDLRMKTRDEVNRLSKAVISLISTLLKVAESNRETLLPAFTHLQHAQPTTLAHHLLSYSGSLMRGMERLEDAYRRVDLCPLGAGAVTTTSFQIDREMTAALLGFDRVLENSMDAVSSRDYMIEIAAAASAISIDLSRIAEELILWSTSEFSYIELSDSTASTSSIMPQKKNPDVLEIIRARTGIVTGGLVSLLTILKGLPQSYNRDLQEASPVFFGLIHVVTSSLETMSTVVEMMKVKAEEMNAACAGDFSTATELADMIVKKTGLPFRTAHQIVGAAVSKAVKDGMGPGGVSSDLLDSIAMSVAGLKLGLSDEEIASALTPSVAVESRRILGGPAPETVGKAIEESRNMLKKKERTIKEIEEGLERSKKALLEQVDSILEA